MKDFWKLTLAVIVAMVVVSVLFTVISVGMLGSLSVEGQGKVVVPTSAVLKIDASNTIVKELPEEFNPMANPRNMEIRTVGIWDAVCAINKAADDPAIKFIYLKPDASGMSIATLQELRAALSNFRAKGKAVITYVENPTTGSCYLSSVSDKVYLTSTHGAMTMLTGISTQMLFLKDLLDKFGVNVQLIRHGKYKSAGEMFVRNSSSEANMEQNQAMVNSLWGEMANAIASSRGISVSDLNAAIDGLKLGDPKDFLTYGLADEMLSRVELEEKIATLAGGESIKDVNFISLPDYIKARIQPNFRARKKIAVIYADGEIVDGDDEQNGVVAGDRFARMIADVRADSTVKAVVLRVNSPGGSVLASDKMKAEIDLCRGVKPVVASYGDLAASGGYWISAACDKIYTNTMTLTGSIGVFSMIPDFSGTLKNVAHVNITAVSSNRHGDMYSLMRPLDKEEQAYMQRSVEDIYDRFVGLVSEGRDMKPKDVDNIAQGRVWSGADALRIGLADEAGTLEDAIHYAAVSAGDPELANWAVEAYPKPLTLMETLMAMLQTPAGVEDHNVFAGTVFETQAASVMKWGRTFAEKGAPSVYARLPYEISFNQ